jgi:GNAT superfamily N-acetyltransferase
MADIEGHVLTKDHLSNFQSFHCGSGNNWCDTLNSFLQENALPEGASRFNTTYVFYSENEPVAYATLSASEITRKHFRFLRQTDSPHPTVPALQIGRIAVDHRYQGQKHGSTILAWIEDLAVRLKVGCRFLVLSCDRENDDARRLYERFGFDAPDDINRGRRELLMFYDLIDTPLAIDEAPAVK